MEEKKNKIENESFLAKWLEGAISDEELKNRKQNWNAPKLKAERGILYKYARSVSSASKGCVTDEF